MQADFLRSRSRFVLKGGTLPRGPDRPSIEFTATGLGLATATNGDRSEINDSREKLRIQALAYFMNGHHLILVISNI